MNHKENNKQVWEIISSIKTGMLNTLTMEDKIHSRPMQVVQDEYEGTLWFFTGNPSEKNMEISNDSDVCVTFSGNDQYLALYGKAQLTKDQNKIDELWNPMVSAWFPEGKESQRCALIKVEIIHGEMWDSNINPFKFVYELGKAKIKNQRPELGEHHQY